MYAHYTYMYFNELFVSLFMHVCASFLTGSIIGGVIGGIVGIGGIVIIGAAIFLLCWNAIMRMKKQNPHNYSGW